jgi:hypothetical protein
VDLTREAEAAFLAELTELTRKHGITIHGCGCCASPYLMASTEATDEKRKYTTGGCDNAIGEYLSWE